MFLYAAVLYINYIKYLRIYQIRYGIRFCQWCQHMTLDTQVLCTYKHQLSWKGRTVFAGLGAANTKNPLFSTYSFTPPQHDVAELKQEKLRVVLFHLVHTRHQCTVHIYVNYLQDSVCTAGGIRNHAILTQMLLVYDHEFSITSNTCDTLFFFFLNHGMWTPLAQLNRELSANRKKHEGPLKYHTLLI